MNACKLLGVDFYQLACEGRLVCIASEHDADEVLHKLQNIDSSAKIIGEITDDKNVIIQTEFGKRILPKPSGRIVARIC